MLQRLLAVVLLSGAAFTATDVHRVPSSAPVQGVGGLGEPGGAAPANPFFDRLVLALGVPTFTAGTNVITAWNNEAPEMTPDPAIDANVFNGSTQGLSATDNATLSVSDTDFGFCTWVNIATIDTTFRRFLIKLGGTPGVEYLFGNYRSSNPDPVAFTVYDSVSGNTTATWGAPALTGRQFWCGWYTASDNKAHVSLNAGTAVDATAGLANGPADSTGTYWAPSTSNSLLGSMGPTWYYKGGIPPVSALYNNGKGIAAGAAPTTNLVCAWPYSETGAATRTSVAGSGGTNCNLTPSANPPSGDGLIATAGSLDGSYCWPGECDLGLTNSPKVSGGGGTHGINLQSGSLQFASAADNAAFTPTTAGRATCGWIEADVIGGTNLYVWGKADGVAANSDYYTYFTAAGNVTVAYYDNSPAAVAYSSPGPELATGERALICDWWDGAGDDKVYFAKNAGTPVASVGTFATANNGTAAVGVGSRGTATQTFDGVIGPVMHWEDGIPSSAVMTSIYNGGKGKRCSDLSSTEKTKMVACWEMSDASGGPYTDSIGSTTLTGTNTPTRGSSVVQIKDALSNASMSARTNGSTSYASTPSRAALQLLDTFSVSCWVNPFVISTCDANWGCGYLAHANGPPGAATTGKPGDYQMAVIPTGQIQFSHRKVAGVDATGRRYSTGGTAIVIGNWYHIVNQRKADTSYEIWQNGVSKSLAAASSYAVAWNGGFYVGRQYSGNYGFNGATAGCSVWSREQSAAEVAQLYASGAGRFYDYAWMLMLRDPIRWAMRALFDPWQTFSRDAELRPYGGA
jgi:hypothetical protein